MLIISSPSSKPKTLSFPLPYFSLHYYSFSYQTPKEKKKKKKREITQKQRIKSPPQLYPMAVEASHMNLFPPQLITNRDFTKTNQGSGNIYNNLQMDSCCVPFVDQIQEASQFFPLYDHQSFVCDPISARTSINKADSCLSYNMNIPVISSATRKRPRDSFINGFDSFTVSRNNKFSGVATVLDDDDDDVNIFSQIQQQHQEIDSFIAEHAEKVRLELEEERKIQTRMLITAIKERVMKKLKEKDEEISRMGKLNWALQEGVTSLYVENQLLRDLAQTNEATANSLRTNLEQVLAHHVSDEERRAMMMSGGGGGGISTTAAALADEAESSCCGSSDEGWRKVVVPLQPLRRGGAEDKAAVVDGVENNRKCRKCGKKESSVVLLPCRHLCLCTTCGSAMVGPCPVCHSITSTSLHVNMSS